jgi:hypothetical protein
VLASNMGGLPEFVRPGEGGLLFDVADHTGVQQALRTVFDGGPAYLKALRAATPPVRTVAEEQVHLASLYERLIRARAPKDVSPRPNSSWPSLRPAMTS